MADVIALTSCSPGLPVGGTMISVLFVSSIVRRLPPGWAIVHGTGGNIFEVSGLVLDLQSGAL